MELAVGNIVTGKVTTITKFGAFVDLGNGKTGMGTFQRLPRSS